MLSNPAFLRLIKKSHNQDMAVHGLIMRTLEKTRLFGLHGINICYAFNIFVQHCLTILNWLCCPQQKEYIITQFPLRTTLTGFCTTMFNSFEYAVLSPAKGIYHHSVPLTYNIDELLYNKV